MSKLEGNSDFLTEKISEEMPENINKGIYGKYANRNNNCINYNNLPGFDVNNLTNINDDSCFQTERTIQSTGTGNYTLSNFNVCDCNMNQVVDTATENPCINFRDGYGVSECNIKRDSQLRVGRTKRFPKCPDQLFTRPFGSIPYMGRGSGNSNLEYKLVTGAETREKKQCNESNVDIDNYFTPLVDSLRNEIQNPKNLVQEVNDNKWIRGGVPTRQIVKDIDYLERCSDTLENKKKLANQKRYLLK